MVFELADVAAEPLVEEIDHGPDARGVADAFMGEQPQHASMILARRKAADEVGIRVGDDARQNGNAEA